MRKLEIVMTKLARVLWIVAALVAFTGQPGAAQDVGIVQPVHRTLTAELASGIYHYAGSFTIPRGRRLVIEYVSARVVQTSPTTILSVNDIAITTTLQNIAVKHSLTNPSGGPTTGLGQYGVGTMFVLGQQVKLYGDGGTPVVATVDVFKYGEVTDGYEMNGTIEWTISGYFIG
jgi:hypothetical protein